MPLLMLVGSVVGFFFEAVFVAAVFVVVVFDGMDRWVWRKR